MLDRIRKLIRADSAGKAAAFRAALSELDADAASAAVADAEAARRAALLESGDAEVVKAEERVAAAKRDRDRIMAAREELERRLAEAELREQEEAWAQERQAAEASADAAAAELARVYPKAAKQIVTALQQVSEAQSRVDAYNAKLIRAKRAEPFVKDVEPRAWKEVENWRQGANYSAVMLTSLRWSDDQPGYGLGEQIGKHG